MPTSAITSRPAVIRAIERMCPRRRIELHALFTKGRLLDVYRASPIVSRRSSTALETAKLRGGLLTALLALVALGAALLPATSAEAASPCGHSTAMPGKLTLHQMRSSELCLINRVRVHYGLVPLHFNAELRDSRSATRTRWSSTATSATSPGGSVDSRISRAGYLSQASSFVIGENIGGGTGRHWGSPMAVFEELDAQPAAPGQHLDPSFRDAGVGVAGDSRSAAAPARRPTRSISAPAATDCKPRTDFLVHPSRKSGNREM